MKSDGNTLLPGGNCAIESWGRSRASVSLRWEEVTQKEWIIEWIIAQIYRFSLYN
jgi:hypothetical protein